MLPYRKRSAVANLEDSFEVSEPQACFGLNQPRSTQGYRSKRASDETLPVTRIHDLVLESPRFGYRRITVLLQREGFLAISIGSIGSDVGEA